MVCFGICRVSVCMFVYIRGDAHPPTASSWSVGETRRPQDGLVHRWELERGEKRHCWLTTPVADLLTDRHTVDGCRIHTHLTQFAGQLKVSVHHSSEELKPYIPSECLSSEFLTFKYSISNLTQSRILTKTKYENHILWIWTKQNTFTD